MRDDVLVFDIETHDAELMWDMRPEEFFRLGQYAWGDGEVVLTTDLEQMRTMIRRARLVVGHNIHAFDLPAIFGRDSIEPLQMALDNRVFDTWTQATLVYPNPGFFTMRPKAEDKPGRKVFGDKPEFTKLWLGLDNLAFQLGIPGKIGDLKAMAKEFGGFGDIPLDNPEFLEYAVQDVVVARAVANKLMDRSKPFIQYYWREQLIAAINAQATRNGVRVDIPAAQDRVAELAVRRKEIMDELVRKYDFPTTGKAPWSTTAGKEAIMTALADYGITERTRPHWDRTATGNLSLGGETLTTITAGTDAEEFGRALAELKGQRSLAQLALDSTRSDGRIHPDITSLQRSGRFSVTKPGLTVWTARGPGAVEKRYFLPEPGCKIVEMDYSNADARVVAAESGDIAFAERFKPGKDGHEINARLFWGDDVYDSNPKRYRQDVKGLGHGWGYRGGKKALSRSTGMPEDVTQGFINTMNSSFPFVVRWQQKCTDMGELGFIENDWGRRMVVENGRSYTQSPALIGQSSTREILCDGLINVARSNIEMMRWFLFSVHDAVVWSIPINELGWAVEDIRTKMERYYRPKTPVSQEIHFPMEAGTPADNWYLASH